MRNSLLRAGAAVIVAASSAAAAAQTYGPSNLPAFNVGPGQSSSVSIGDTFSAATGINPPIGSNLYNFVDVYTFTTDPGTAAVDTITFDLSNAISNMQLAIFAGSPAGYASPGTYINQIGSTSGAVSGGGWGSDVSTVVGGVETVVTLTGVSLAPGGSYTLEIRGDAPPLAGSSTASYSGNVAIQGLALPEPDAVSLFLLGLGLVGATVVLNRRRTARA